MTKNYYRQPTPCTTNKAKNDQLHPTGYTMDKVTGKKHQQTPSGASQNPDEHKIYTTIRGQREDFLIGDIGRGDCIIWIVGRKSG